MRSSRSTSGAPRSSSACGASCKRIPRGETRSYGDVAAAVGVPGGARAVGAACGSNPVSVVVPCHRVVTATGGLGGYAWGVDVKEALLEREGARSSGRGA